MKIAKTVLTISISALVASAAMAQGTDTMIQRNINQQERIEKGLESGALNTREAARLEREQAQVERMQSNALKDGKLTDAEKERVKAAQDRVSKDIYREKHDAQKGDPNSYASRRMQADVQRNIIQQERIQQGYQSGQLTNREVGKLERGQARTNQMEGNAGRNGYVGPHEQRRIQAAQNHQSQRIFREKHDKQVRN